VVLSIDRMLRVWDGALGFSSSSVVSAKVDSGWLRVKLVCRFIVRWV